MLMVNIIDRIKRWIFRTRAKGTESRGGVGSRVEIGFSTLHTRGYRPASGERTFAGYVEQTIIQAGGEITVIRPSLREAFRIGPSGRHGIRGPHVHLRYRYIAPDGRVYEGIRRDAIPAQRRHIKDLYSALSRGTYRKRGGR